MLLVLQAGTLRLCSEHPRDQEQAWRHPVIALQTSSTHTHNTDKVPVLLPTGTGGSKERRGERGWGLGGGSHGKPRGRVFGGCGTCSPCAAGVGSALTSAAQLSAPLLLLWSTSTPLGGGGVVPLKGRCRPQNCLRWCPLQLKWSRGPKRPPLGPLMGDLCFAIQVWDLSPFQGWGKVGKVGGGGATCPAGLCVFHHRWARVPLRGGRVQLLRPQPHPAGSCSVPDSREWWWGFYLRGAPTNHTSASPRAPSGGSEWGREGSLSRGKNPALRQQGMDKASSFQGES